MVRPTTPPTLSSRPQPAWRRAGGVLALLAILGTFLGWWGLQPCGWLDSAAGHASGCLAYPVNTGMAQVEALAFSPDGSLLAAGSSDARIRIWSMSTGDQLHVLEEYSPGSSLAFSPDSKTLAYGGFSGPYFTRLWNVAGEQQALFLLSLRNQITSVAFSSDGAILATGGSEERIRLIQIETGHQLLKLNGYAGGASSGDSSLRFLPGDRVLAAATGPDRNDQSRVALWDIASGKQVAEFGFEGRVRFAPDGKLFAVDNSNSDGTIDILALPGAERVQTIRYPEGTAGAHPAVIAFSSDSRRLAVLGNHAGPLGIWDVQTGQPVYTARAVPMDSGSIAFAPDGRELALGHRYTDFRIALRLAQGAITFWGTGP